MPGFSSKAWLDAHQPWTYTTTRRRTYAARPISTPRLIAYFGAMEGASIQRQQIETRALLREAFPMRLSFAWRGDPVDEIIEAPPEQQGEILRSFFASLGMMRESPRSKTPSSVSSSS